MTVLSAKLPAHRQDMNDAALPTRRSLLGGGANLIRVILDGSQLGSTQGDLRMPGFGQAYTDTEIAAVSNYVLDHFGAKTVKVSPSDVANACRE